nr:RsbRD N-terminal domain-containing protein [Myxococcota bacterium]
MSGGSVDAASAARDRSDIDALVDAIRSRRDRIIDCFLQRARERIGLEDLSQQELRDRMPLILDGLADLLTPSALAESADLEPHTADRLERGFELTLILREYEILRECVVDAWQEALGGASLPAGAVRRLGNAFAVVTGYAARRHHEEEERHLRALEVFVSASATFADDVDTSLARLGERTLDAIGSAASIAFHVGGDVAREVATRADRDGSAESDPALAARARRERSVVEER